MEPQKIREGYLVKKVRDKTVLIERWSPLFLYCQTLLGFGRTWGDGTEPVGQKWAFTLTAA